MEAQIKTRGRPAGPRKRGSRWWARIKGVEMTAPRDVQTEEAAREWYRSKRKEVEPNWDWPIPGQRMTINFGPEDLQAIDRIVRRMESQMVGVAIDRSTAVRHAIRLAAAIPENGH